MFRYIPLIDSEQRTHQPVKTGGLVRFLRWRWGGSRLHGAMILPFHSLGRSALSISVTASRRRRNWSEESM